MSDPAFWADVVVGVHLAYAGFIVLAQIVILIGAFRGWQWIRNFWFRLIHLAMMLYVAAEAALGVTCPLTVLEQDLRRQAGETEPQSFTGFLIHNVLFIPGIPNWAFPLIHLCFGAIVLATFVWAPPRWPFRRSSENHP